jgi:outer membrane protein OmpA-like peptidoglycan-associated protein
VLPDDNQRHTQRRVIGRLIVKQFFKLPALTLAAALLSAGSVYALERAAPQQMAQAGPDDEAGPPAEKGSPKAEPKEKGEPKEPRGGGDGPPARARDGGDGPPAARSRGDGEGGARQRGDGEGGARQRGDGDGDGPPRRQKAQDDDGPGERPARPARDKDAEPRERKAPSPAANDDEPPALKKKADPDEPKAPPAKKEPPAEKAAPAEKKAPEPKAEPKDEPAPKQIEPKAAPAEKAPAEPAQRKKADPAPDTDLKDPTPKPGEKEPPAGGPPPKGPDGIAPKEAPKEGLPKEGPPPKEGRAAEPAAPGAAVAAPPEVKDLKELKQERKERSEDGGKRIVIEEPDKRTIVKEGGKTIIRHDETERFRRLGGNTRREKRNGLDISISVSPAGLEIYTESDDRGRPLRRYRRDRDGREVILFDNRDYYRRHREGSFVDAIVDLPPPRIVIPREDYIVDYEEATDVEVYDALAAPPVEELDRTYSLEEVRRSPTLRDRMRRIDLDAINFAFGAFDVGPDQYPALERIAKAMKRVIERNQNEMFMIEGHTDAVGSDEDNLSLSDRRAESVSIILTEEFGVPPENMTTQGYGEQYLKVNTDAAERQNRRVAVRRITPLLSRGN